VKKLKEQKGTAAVEFALVLIPLILLIFGAIEFGVLLYNKQVITNASREGARAGIVSQDTRLPVLGGTCSNYPPESIKCVVQNYSKQHLITFGTPNDPQIDDLDDSGESTYKESPNAPKPYLWINVTYNYSFLVLPNFIPGLNKLLTLKARTVMRYE